MQMKKSICITGVPYSYGSGGARDRDWNNENAPNALRNVGLLNVLSGRKVLDKGNLEIGNAEAVPLGESYRLAQVLNAIKELYKHTLEVHEGGNFPLTIGGDHSLTIGSALATQQKFQKIGLISIDRHSDMWRTGIHNNQPQIGCTNYLKAITNLKPTAILSPLTNCPVDCISPSNAVVIGANDDYDLNNKMCASDRDKVFTDNDIAKHGIEDIVKEAIKRATDGTNGVYLSFDIDALNSEIAPGANFPGGPLTLAQAQQIVQMIMRNCNVVGADVVEVKPNKDEYGVTSHSAVKIIESLFER